MKRSNVQCTNTTLLTFTALGTNGYAYAFDPIGNRLTTDEPEFSAVYFANSLNQYTRISNSVPPAEFVPEFDADGNQTLLKTATGIWRVTYNAENRPVVFSNETAVIEMLFDYMGRRFEYKETVSATLTRHERHLYRGCLRVAALDLLVETNVLHSIAWDPAEPTATRPLSLQSGENWWCYGFDQVKNVTELFDASGTLVAAYDYAPFGGTVSASGSAVAVNPLTFSSEIDDAVLGLIHYTFRPLNTLDGRWIGRDPIEEFGGVNLYVTSGNNCMANYDCLGLSFVDWLPFAGTLKTIIENMVEAIPGQDADNYPASVTLRRCCEAGDGIAETECEQLNNDMFYLYSRDFSIDAFKGKVLEVVAVVIIKNPAISLAALVDGLTAGINWVDVLNDMRKARDAANAKNCDCSKTGYIPQGT